MGKKKATTTKIENPISIMGQDANQKILSRAIELNLPVLLIGETGTGKTSIIRERAFIEGADLIRVNLNGQTSVDEIVGKWLIKGGATYWQDGVLIQAMKKGSWILIDEINASLPEVLFALHSLLDDDRKIIIAEKDGEEVKPHPDFRFFATMNPSEEYAGTKELNKAFLSRFPVILDFDFLPPKDEIMLLEARSGISHQDASLLVNFATRIRELKTKQEIFYTLSTRDLIFWANFVQELGLGDSFRIAVLNRAYNGDKEILIREYRTMIGKIDEYLKKYGVGSVTDIFASIDKREDELKNRELKLNQIKKEIAEGSIEALLKGI